MYIHGYEPMSYLLVGGSSFFNNIVMMSNAIDPALIFFYIFTIMLVDCSLGSSFVILIHVCHSICQGNKTYYLYQHEVNQNYKKKFLYFECLLNYVRLCSVLSQRRLIVK
jgi:hypothetical protein